MGLGHEMGEGLIGSGRYAEYLEAFTEALRERLGGCLLAVVLYGSVARGTASKTSDIDLLIIQREAPASYCERLGPILAVKEALRGCEAFHALVGQGFSPSISVIVLSEAEAAENRYIFLDMVEEAVILLDPDGFFARRMQELRERLRELGARRIPLPDGTWYWDLKPDLVLGEVFEL